MYEKKDIFISFKKTDPDDRNKNTPDYLIGDKLYDELTKRGFKTFFSERTIKEEGSSDYQSSIDKRIEEAKIMIVIGTDERYVFEPGLLMEWTTFNDYINLPLSKQKIHKKLYSFLIGVDPRNIQKRGFPSTESYEIDSIENIDFDDFIENMLKPALEEDIYIDLINQSRESLEYFINSNNLSEKYEKDLFGSIKTDSKFFSSLSEVYDSLLKTKDNNSLRISVSGENNSGRKTQILDLWNHILDKNFDANNIILHIPLSNNFFSTSNNIYEYLYRTYFDKLLVQNDLENFEEIYQYFSDLINSYGYRFLLLVDGIDSIINKEGGLTLDNLNSFLSNDNSLLQKTDIIIRNPNNKCFYSFNDYHIESLTKEQKVDFLSNYQITNVSDKHIIENLNTAKSIINLINNKKNLSKVAKFVDDLIDDIIRDLEERNFNLVLKKELFYYSLKFILPIFTALNPSKEFNISDLEDSFNNTISFILENNIDYKDTEELNKETIISFLKSPDLFKKVILDFCTDLAGLFEINGDSIIWKNNYILDSFRSKGIFILNQQNDLNENLAFNNLKEELDQLRIQLIRPDKTVINTNQNILNQAQNVFEFLSDLDDEIDVYFIANIAIVLDSYGDENLKFDFAKKALFRLLDIYPENSNSNTLAQNLSAISYIKNKARVDEKIKDPYKDLSYRALNKALELTRNNSDGKIIDAKIHSNLGSFWLNYASQFPYDQAKEFINKALDEHNKSLMVRKALINTEEVNQKELRYGLRRSYTCIATDYFKLRDFSSAAEYNEKAYTIGEEISDPERYENYSRRAGALISLNNQKNSWNNKSLLEILRLLESSYKIMKDRDEIINKNEIRDLYDKLGTLVDKISELTLTKSEIEEFIAITRLIETAYRETLVIGSNRLTEKLTNILYNKNDFEKNIHILLGTISKARELAEFRMEYFDEVYELAEEERNYLLIKNYKYNRDNLGDNFYIAYAIENDITIISSAYLNIYTKASNLGTPNGVYGEIYGVFTKPEYRRKGYSTQCMKLLINTAKDLGVSQITLDASLEGIELYKKLGFSESSLGYTEMDLNLINISDLINKN